MKTSLGAKTFAYPLPIWVIGSYDAEGKPNVMTAAWCGICCSKPPAIAVSLRKERHSYDSIVKRKAFTVNIPSEKYAKETDYFGLVSGKDVDKFAATGLTPVKSGTVDAPYIKEFRVIIECKLIHTYDIGLHTQFVGEIMDIKADEELVGEGGYPEIEKIKPLVFTPGLRKYHGLGKCVGDAFDIGKEFKK